MRPPLLVGAVEAGGTNINLAVGTGPHDIRLRESFRTARPDETLPRVVAFFEAADVGEIAAFGVAAFGPVRVARDAPDFGRVLATPKPGWAGASFVEPIARRLGRPVALDTDVNAAALGEQRHGAARGARVAAYLTVGTGIGLGIAVDGRPLHGMLHPEFGHIRLSRDPADGWPGHCPFHGDCLEGLASGPAIEARWGASLSRLTSGHPAFEQVADYLGQACASLALTLSPERIVVGGGVARTEGLHEAVRLRMHRWLGGYLREPALVADDYVCAPGLGADAALAGAMLLAQGLIASPA